MLCSIDPPGCTDVDDALSVRWLDSSGGSGGSGGKGAGGGRKLVEVGVHIADVSYFVRQVRVIHRDVPWNVQQGWRQSACMNSLASQHLRVVSSCA